MVIGDFKNAVLKTDTFFVILSVRLHSSKSCFTDWLCNGSAEFLILSSLLFERKYKITIAIIPTIHMEKNKHPKMAGEFLLTETVKSFAHPVVLICDIEGLNFPSTLVPVSVILFRLSIS